MSRWLSAFLALVLLVGAVGMAQAGVDTDVVINEVGYRLDKTNDVPAWQQVDPVQFASKVASGDLKYSDGSFESIWSQSNWYGGRGQDYFDDPARFRDSYQVNTMVRNQAVLAPRQVKANFAVSAPEYMPSSYFGTATKNEAAAPQYTTDASFAQVIPGYGYSESFVPTYDITVTYVWLKARRIASVGDYDTIHVGIANNATGTKPGTTRQEATVPASSFPTSYGWIKVQLAAATTLTAGTTYHVYIYQEHSNPIGDLNASIDLRVSTGTTGYAGTASTATGITTSGTGTWTSGSSFDMSFDLGSVEQMLSQSFLVGGTNLDVTHLYLLLKKVGNPTGNLTVGIYNEDADTELPSTLFAVTADVTLAMSSLNTDWTWHKFTLEATQTLTANTHYCVVVSQPAGNDKDNYVFWASTSGDGYANRKGGQCISNAGTWAAIANRDFAFRINEGQVNVGAEIRSFAQYASALYGGGGAKLIRWQYNASQFTVVASNLGTSVRQIMPFSPATSSNLLFIALETDDATDEKFWVYNANTNSIRQANSNARVFTTFLDRIYRAHNNIIYYTTNPGTDGNGTWTEVCKVGDGDNPINGLAVLDGRLYAGKWDGVYMVADNEALKMLDFTSQRTYYNCEKMKEWQGSLYIPVAVGGLWRYNGNTMVNIGPDQDMGMPAGRQGPIVDMCPTMNALYCALDGNQNKSSILAYNNAGWHEVVRGRANGARIRGVGFTPGTGPFWMWFSHSNDVHYMEYSVNTDNPYLWDGACFNGEGYIDTSWFHGGLQEISKSFRNVSIESHNLSLETDAKRYIEVYYAIDDEGTRGATSFSLVGTVGQSNISQVQTLRFPNNAIGKKIQMRFKLQTETMAETPVLRSYALRYLPKPRPRFGWKLRIPCQDKLITLDRAACTTTGANLKASLQSARAAVAPITYFDRDGAGYMVDVTSLTFNMVRSGTNRIDYMADIALVEADPTERTGESESEPSQG